MVVLNVVDLVTEEVEARGSGSAAFTFTSGGFPVCIHNTVMI